MLFLSTRDKLIFFLAFTDEVGKGDGEEDKSDEEDWEDVGGSTDEEEDDGEEIMEQDEPTT